MPQLVAPWLRQHPQVKLILEIADRVGRRGWTPGTTFMVMSAKQQPLAVSPLAEDELLLTVLADYPGPTRRSAQSNWVSFLCGQGDRSGTRVGYESAFADVGVDPDGCRQYLLPAAPAVLTAEAGPPLVALGARTWLGRLPVLGEAPTRRFYVVAYPDRFLRWQKKLACISAVNRA